MTLRSHQRGLLGLVAVLAGATAVLTMVLLGWLRQFELNRASERLEAAAALFAARFDGAPRGYPHRATATTRQGSGISTVERFWHVTVVNRGAGNVAEWSTAPRALQNALLASIDTLQPGAARIRLLDQEYLTAIALMPPRADTSHMPRHAIMSQRMGDALSAYDGMRALVLWVAGGALLILSAGAHLLCRRCFEPLVTAATAAQDFARSLQSGRSSDAVNASGRAHDLAETLQRIAHEAQHDPLTGLCNRVLVPERIARCAARHRRYGGAFCVVFIDLDGFKAVNDRHGHRAGDEVLCEVAKRLEASVRPSDTAARMGGDEFLILLDQVEIDMANAIAAKIAECIAQPIHTGHGIVHVGMSWGIAEYPRHGIDAERLINHADTCMYGEKTRRRQAADRKTPIATANGDASSKENVGGNLTAYEAARICARMATRLYQAHNRQKSGTLQAAQATMLAQQGVRQAQRRSGPGRGYGQQ